MQLVCGVRWIGARALQNESGRCHAFDRLSDIVPGQQPVLALTVPCLRGDASNHARSVTVVAHVAIQANLNGLQLSKSPIGRTASRIVPELQGLGFRTREGGSPTLRELTAELQIESA